MVDYLISVRAFARALQRVALGRLTSGRLPVALKPGAAKRRRPIPVVEVTLGSHDDGGGAPWFGLALAHSWGGVVRTWEGVLPGEGSQMDAARAALLVPDIIVRVPAHRLARVLAHQPRDSYVRVSRGPRGGLRIVLGSSPIEVLPAPADSARIERIAFARALDAGRSALSNADLEAILNARPGEKAEILADGIPAGVLGEVGSGLWAMAASTSVRPGWVGARGQPRDISVERTAEVYLAIASQVVAAGLARPAFMGECIVATGHPEATGSLTAFRSVEEVAAEGWGAAVPLQTFRALSRCFDRSEPVRITRVSNTLLFGSARTCLAILTDARPAPDLAPLASRRRDVLLVDRSDLQSALRRMRAVATGHAPVTLSVMNDALHLAADDPSGWFEAQGETRIPMIHPVAVQPFTVAVPAARLQAAVDHQLAPTIEISLDPALRTVDVGSIRQSPWGVCRFRLPARGEWAAER